MRKKGQTGKIGSGNLLQVASIGHFQKYHNTLCLSSKILHKYCFILSWDHSKSQEKMETMFMENFGGTNKEYYGIFASCLLPLSSVSWSNASW